jgi:hypothetical protein
MFALLRRQEIERYKQAANERIAADFFDVVAML